MPPNSTGVLSYFMAKKSVYYQRDSTLSNVASLKELYEAAEKDQKCSINVNPIPSPPNFAPTALKLALLHSFLKNIFINFEVHLNFRF